MPRTNDERITALEVNQDGVAAEFHRIDERLSSLDHKVDRLSDKLAARPSWAVCLIIAGLGSLSTALGATLLTLLVQSA